MKILIKKELIFIYFMLVFFVALFIIILFFISGCQIKQQENKIKISEQAFVTNVIDGDTVEIGNESIRLLGVNAPEKGEKCYQEAKDFLKQLENRTVYLEKTSENKDKYNRYLRFIYLNPEDNNSINLMLIKNGFAVAYFPNENILHKTEFIEAEKQAVESRAGCLWRDVALSKCIVIDSFNYNPEGNDCEIPENEYVILKNICDAINMTGWQISDTGRHRYNFNLTLEKNSLLILHSGFGQDSYSKVIELYWNHKDICPAIWDDHGDTLYLRNDQYQLVLRYNY